MYVGRQEQETLEYLDAHLRALHGGLQALLDLLADSSPGKQVRATSMHLLLGWMADEASQAEPLARLLLAAATAPEPPLPL